MNDPAGMISDEILHAFVDGELDAKGVARIEAAMARDPMLAQRVAAQRALRRNLQQHFAGVLDEPVPLRLHAIARGSPTTTRPAWQQWGAMAASLLLGVVLGVAMLGTRSKAPFAMVEGRLLARGELDDALTGQLSGPAGGRVEIYMSVATREGETCRSFALTEGPAGLACRRGDAWVVDVLAGASPASGGREFRQAGTALPETVRLAIEARAAGDPLSAQQEAQLRDSGWDTRRAPAR